MKCKNGFLNGAIVGLIFTFFLFSLSGCGSTDFKKGDSSMSAVMEVAKSSRSECVRCLEYPEPTEVTGITMDREARKRFKQNRKEYFELRHRHGPDVDWRAMDMETRQEIRQERQKLIKTLKEEGKLKKGEPNVETFSLKSGTKSVSSTAQSFLDNESVNQRGVLSGQWIEMGSNNQAGRMHTADVYSDGTIYAGSAGGIIWKATLNGNDWEPISDPHQFDDIMMVRVIPKGTGKRILVLDSDNLYYSDDEGLTWNSAEVDTKNLRSESGFVLNNSMNDIYILADKSDIYKSVDMGESLRKIKSFSSSSTLALWAPYYPYEESKVFLLVDKEFYRFDDNDDAVLVGELPDSLSTSYIDGYKGVRLAGCDIKEGSFIYAVIPKNSYDGQPEGTEFYASEDGGKTWEYRSFIEGVKPFGKNSFAVSTTDPDLVYFGGACDLVHSSRDGARNWSVPDYEWWHYYDDYLNKLHCDIPGINVFRDSSGNEYELIHTDGGTYISYDDIQNVTNLSISNLRISQYYSTYTHRDRTDIIYAGSQDQGFQRSIPQSGEFDRSGELYDFEQIISGDDASIVSIDGGESIWFVYPGILYFMQNATTADSNNGYNFSSMMEDNLWLVPLMEDPDDPLSVYMGGGRPVDKDSGAYLYRWTFDGNNFSWTKGDFNFNDTISAMAYSPIDTNYRYLLNMSGDFFYSSDGGLNWTQSDYDTGVSGFYLFGATIVASPVELGKVYIGGSGYSNDNVFESDNHGVDFENMSNGMPDTIVNQLAITPEGELLFAATDTGPYACFVENCEWEHIGGLSAPDQQYFSVDFVPAIDTARFGTYGRGIWDFEITDVSHEDYISDLTGEWLFFSSDKLNNGKYSIDGTLNFYNNGTKIYSGSTTVNFYLSDDDVLSSDDRYVKQETVWFYEGGNAAFINISNVVNSKIVEGKYVISFIDPDNLVTESDEENNVFASPVIGKDVDDDNGDDDDVVDTIVIPDTGQTDSYTDVFGEDSDYTINPPSYTDNGDGTVTDNNSGLLWQQSDDGQKRIWANAEPYCDALYFAGYEDWRLPTIKELSRIVNYGTGDPAVDIAYFPDMKSANYWSSTVHLGWSSVFNVSFLDGAVTASVNGSDYYVLCVR